MEPRRAEHSPQRSESELRRSTTSRAARGYSGGEEHAGGLPYTEKPAFDENETGGGEPPPRPDKRPWLAVVAAAAVLLASVGTTWMVKPEWRPWGAAQTQSADAPVPRVTLSSVDIDQAATAAARAALLRGEIPPVLANVSAETRRRIAAGEESLYSKKLLDVPDARPGEPARTNDVRIHVVMTIGGSVVVDEILTREHPASTPFPIGTDTPTRFHFTVEQPGGNGSVTCSVRSNVSGVMASTRPLAQGESADLEAITR